MIARIILLLILVAAPLRAALNESVLLDAIADVETGNRDMRGKAGERGPWQLTPWVARKMGGHDRVAAQRWLTHLIDLLNTHHVDVTSHTLAMMWNAGPSAVLRSRIPMSSYDYANRVSEVYGNRLMRGKPQAPLRFNLVKP